MVLFCSHKENLRDRLVSRVEAQNHLQHASSHCFHTLLHTFGTLSSEQGENLHFYESVFCVINENWIGFGRSNSMSWWQQLNLFSPLLREEISWIQMFMAKEVAHTRNTRQITLRHDTFRPKIYNQPHTLVRSLLCYLREKSCEIKVQINCSNSESNDSYKSPLSTQSVVQ